ncbi:conserved hypothetical protein [Acaryochloris marina MBIC11017]|uniref:Transposase n=1 Tax=Acaryochloris marina (strain MBIC 11017) TaxID=329726 RepID=B0CAK2_ACAM1|nr:conserved hypothetical protein [Acaryochloris marina MBIC11017]
MSKALTQRLERTNGILWQQTGRWHRRQNKFGKVWQQSTVTLRLVLTYFNWIWCHSRFKKYGCTTCWADGTSLGMARFSHLSHTLLMHNRCS